MNLPLVTYHVQALNPSSAIDNRHDFSIPQIHGNLTLASICVSALIIYYLFTYPDVLPLSISRALCDFVIYLTPSRIVFAMDKMSSVTKIVVEKPASTSFSSFQAKRDAIQRILGLNGSSLYSILTSARSFVGIGNALLGTNEHMPPGLGNWDNSCYQNSVIQGLASLRSLRVFLERSALELVAEGPLSTRNALKEIIERLNHSSNYGQKLWLPPELKSMSSWQQQDAQEYFSKIVVQIDREILQASKGPTENLGLKVAGPREHVLGISFPQDDGMPSLKPRELLSLLRNPLEGLLAQRVGCMRCGWTEGLSLIPFNCLTVPLGANWEYDVRDCLDEYMNLEPIEGVECAKCTLLRTREQLHHLLKQIDEDTELISGPDSSRLSGALKIPAQSRLQAVQEAIDNEDFTEKTLSKKCHIPARSRLSTTKSRQAVIARAPAALVIHINRSLFDDRTGVMRKNYASVRFSNVLDLDEWCLGPTAEGRGGEALELWNTDPQESMLPHSGMSVDSPHKRYELRAVVTHYGRHDNGHYICYRKYPVESFPVDVPEEICETDGEKERSERWFRLSDDEVQMVSEQSVLAQGGVFMLFYECVREQEPKNGNSGVDVESELDKSDAISVEKAITFTGPQEVPHVASVSEHAAAGISSSDKSSPAEPNRATTVSQSSHVYPKQLSTISVKNDLAPLSTLLGATAFSNRSIQEPAVTISPPSLVTAP